MNKFKKKSKTKGLALGIAILSSAAVVSTGFAAWVISGGETNTDISGTITADTVKNSYHGIEIVGSKTDTFFFGAPESASTGWLTNDAKDGTEDLSAQFTLKVSGLDDESTNPSELFSSITLTEDSDFEPGVGKITFAAAAKYEGGGKTGLIAALPTFDAKNKTNYDSSVDEKKDAKIFLVSSKDFDNAARTQTFVLTIRLAWGGIFGGLNPFNYYNDGEKTASSYKDEATKYLNELSKINSKLKLSISTEK